MKKYILLLILSFFSTILFSQTDSTKIAFVAYWSLGDSYNFKVSKSKKQWKGEELTKDEQEDYIANFTVIDSTENSYTIKWSYENDLGNTYSVPQELVSKLSKYNLTEVTYKTSEYGDFLEILNWEEVGEMMNNMFDDIVEVFGEKDEIKLKALKATMLPLKEIYSSKQGIEELVFKELQYFHFPMGIELNINEEITYEEEIPNMFGGNPINTNAKLYFENVDFEEGFCVFQHERNLDPDDTKQMLEQMFSVMNFNGQEMQDALNTAYFKIDDKTTYEYYYNPGIPHRIEASREFIIDVNQDKGKGIEKTIIELVYNE